jgi:hypothetical protein
MERTMEKRKTGNERQIKKNEKRKGEKEERK